MSLLGKVLAVLNLAALLGFVYMAAVDFQMRQAWSYAVLRWDVALDGMPVDQTDVDQHGRPRYLNFTEGLCNELVNDATIQTQEEYLDKRKQELLARIDDDTVKPSKVDKTVDVLVVLALTQAQREAYHASRNDKSLDNAKKLRGQLDERFEALSKITDHEGKKLTIGRTLVSLLDLLPTDAEKKQRAEDWAKPANQQADPAADPGYRRALNVIGTRTMARVLDLQAKEFLTMAISVGEVRQQVRTSFVYQHQSMIGDLMNREHQLQDQKDKLAVVAAQATEAETKAGLQERLVKDKRDELETKRDLTANALERLSAEQEKLYAVRLRLRDANQKNQKMEQAIRKLESEIESENP